MFEVSRVEFDHLTDLANYLLCIRLDSLDGIRVIFSARSHAVKIRHFSTSRHSLSLIHEGLTAVA